MLKSRGCMVSRSEGYICKSSLLVHLCSWESPESKAPLQESDALQQHMVQHCFTLSLLLCLPCITWLPFPVFWTSEHHRHGSFRYFKTKSFKRNPWMFTVMYCLFQTRFKSLQMYHHTHLKVYTLPGWVMAKRLVWFFNNGEEKEDRTVHANWGSMF